MKKILLTLIITISLSISGLSLDLEGLRDEVRLSINDNANNSAAQYYSDTELNRRINSAIKNIVKRTQCIHKRYTTNTTTGTREYSLPTDVIEIERVYIINESSTHTYTRLDYTTLNELDRNTTEWEDADNAEPTDYYLRVATTGVKLGLYPEPDEDYAGTNYLRIDYVPIPDTLSSNTDEPFFGLAYLKPYHDLIIDYVVWRCNNNPKFLQLYDARLQIMKKELNIFPDKITHIKYKN